MEVAEVKHLTRRRRLRSSSRSLPTGSSPCRLLPQEPTHRKLSLLGLTSSSAKAELQRLEQEAYPEESEPC
ncbi:unnamed protein product [Gadus morhua 'NCC']